MKEHKSLSYFLIYSLIIHTLVIASLLLSPRKKTVRIASPTLAMTTVNLQKKIKSPTKQKHTLTKRPAAKPTAEKKPITKKAPKKKTNIVKRTKQESTPSTFKNEKKKKQSNREALAKLTAQLQGLEKSIKSHSHRIQYKVPVDNRKVEEYYELVGALLKKHILLTNREPIHIKIKIRPDGKVSSCTTKDNTYYSDLISKIEVIHFPPTREWFEGKNSIEITLVLEPI